MSSISIFSSARIPLASPLTRSSLNCIRAALATAWTDVSAVPDPGEKHAAVLVPFCNVNNTPGILLQVRGKLRTHSGEVSFPGGRLDKTDKDLLSAALRETQEELGIHPNQVEILGQFGPPQTSLGGLRVWPYVGFVHDGSSTPDSNWSVADTNADAALPSLPLGSLRLSRTEVAHAFHLPLSALVSPTRIHSYKFRGVQPYNAISVADLVAGLNAVHTDASRDADVHWTSDPEQRDEIGGGRDGRLEVWGLTGWYLSELMRILGVYHPQSTG